ncbi:Helicase associated domain protein [Actinacidiphila sp. bgisy167]|uniref:helicase associated domain-containing protein n=1 Tax=Actinacidiphila sp. bgisy167 TaxID=3413797 RepID=UPI003D719E5C
MVEMYSVMTEMDPLPHQIEASDAAMRALELAPGQDMPAQGLRTQVIAATGSGKTFIGVLTARKLRAGRVLVLVPTLDLLTQMAAAWRTGGRSGPFYGICSLRADEAPFACTTDVDELIAWTRGLETVTVFATYASVGMGTLQRAHAAGLSPWSLIIVDEAHRTSGRAGKPWAAVHDNTRIPADRRLYMTATPRVWEAPDTDGGGGRGGGGGGGAGPVLVASMEDDPDGVFGAVAYRLTLSQARDRGLVAAYQVVCVDVTDPELQAAALLGMESRSDSVRGSRLAALQTAAVKTAAVRGLRRMLTFHYRTSEAEAMAAGVPAVARRLWEHDPVTYAEPDRVWASWLCGEHSPARRRATLATFADPVGQGDDGGLVPMRLRLLSSVRILGEGVDTPGCDSVFFGDVRGSAVDILQIVGRALRMRPGEGKVASLVVPVFLAPGEDPDAMLTSKGYNGLAKVMAALRSHDTETIEQLAEQQAHSRTAKPSAAETAATSGLGGESGPGGEGALSAPARGLLSFSTPRDPAILARFMSLRVLRPENAYWRAGIQAATRYVKENGDLRVPYAFTTPDDWDPAAFPLGTWIAEQRRVFNAGEIKPVRAAELDDLGMVWSHWDVAWQEGLSAARQWAAVHGHLLPPATAVWNGYPVGVWTKNQRTAGRLAETIAQRREAGLPVGSTAGALSEERRDALEAIDPSWCPSWPVVWQRSYRLCRKLIEAGQPLPVVPGQVSVQGEDLGAWVQAQRLRWDALLPAQAWMLENMLHLSPADPSERPQAPRTQADKWAVNLRAARQFHAREGSLQPARKHIERLADPDGVVTEVKLGQFVANARRRAAKLTEGRRAELDALGMRW